MLLQNLFIVFSGGALVRGVASEFVSKSWVGFEKNVRDRVQSSQWNRVLFSYSVKKV